MFTEALNPNELLMIFRVLVAGLLGLLIGIERKGGRQGAGARTFALVCMGSALFTTVSIYAFPETTDPSRLAAQIVSGIGFIGAGIIWRSRTEIVHGLTTATAIWCSSAVGIAAGTGRYYLATASTLATMFILAHGHPIQEAKENLNIEETPVKSHLEDI